MAHLIRGSAVGHPRATGATAPAADTSGYLVKGSSVARPCPEGATMPENDSSGFLVKGRGWWRAPCVDEVTECECGITDTFTRTETGIWGTSDATITWGNGGGTGTRSVNGTQGVIEITNGSQSAFLPFDTVTTRCLVLIQLTGAVSTPGDGWDIRISKEGGAFASVLLYADGTLELFTDNTGNDSASVADATVPLWVLIETDGTNATAKVWADGDVEPGSPTMSHPFNAPGGAFYTDDLNIRAFSDGADVTVLVDSVDIEWVDTCVFDSFTREEASDWGDTTPAGYTWVQDDTGGSVDDVGTLEGTDVSPTETIDDPTGPWSEPSYTMTFHFRSATILADGSSNPRLDVEVGGYLVTARFNSVSGYIQIGDGFFEKLDWVTDTWYVVKVVVAAGVASLTVWEVGDTEPAAQATTSTIDGDPDLLVIGAASSSGEPFWFDIDNIRFITCPDDEG